MEKPSWDDAPEWAMWYAVDENGTRHWFENEPVIDEYMGEWFPKAGGRVLRVADSGWRTTLEQRPTD